LYLSHAIMCLSMLQQQNKTLQRHRLMLDVHSGLARLKVEELVANTIASD